MKPTQPEGLDSSALFKLYASLDHSASSSSFFPDPGQPARSASSHQVLLWIDSETNDPRTAKEIRAKHSKLDIVFRPSFASAQEYMSANARDLDDFEVFIIICRGYYADEKKSCMDVAQLFSVCHASRTHLAVYTRNRTDLKARTPNLPPTVEIFEKREEILTFVDKCLSKK